MTDRIHIRDLLLRGIVGINDEERRNCSVDILINITLDADTRPAGRSTRSRMRSTTVRLRSA